MRFWAIDAIPAHPAVTVNVVGFQWSWAFNYVENVDGKLSTPSKVPSEISMISAKKLDAPPGAEGVYDFGTPATKNAARQP